MSESTNVIQYTKFIPRPYQREMLKARANGVLRGVSIMHRRAGKDLTMLNMFAAEALKRVGLYLYYFPTIKLGKQVIWKGMDKEGHPFLSYIPPDLIANKNDTDLRLELINGSIIQIMGTDNLDVNVVGMNPVGVAFSEYALQNPLAWELTRPVLRENGGWAWFIYTPRGRNHGKRLYDVAKGHPETWFCQRLSIHDTRDNAGKPILTDGDMAREIEEGMDPDLAQQEFLVSFDAPMQGSYFGRLLATAYAKDRVAPLAYDSTLGPVTVGWDIGRGDATAIWFAQFRGDDIHLIDYYENVGEHFDHYAKVLLEKPYLYSSWIFPHDVAAEHFETRYSAEALARKVCEKRNIHVRVVPKTMDVDIGITAVRRFFPRFRFDSHNCNELKYRGHTALDAIASYHKKWNEVKQEFEDEPHHNWASHCADGLRTLVCGLREERPSRTQITYATTFDVMHDENKEAYDTDMDPFRYEQERENYAFS